MEIMIAAEQITLLSQGGKARPKNAYVDGKATGPRLRNGAPVVGVPMAAIVEGADLADVDLAVETSTPLEEVSAATIFAAEGECVLRIRADGRAGFGDGGPRGALIGTLYVERVVPRGDLAALLGKAAQHRKPAENHG